MSKLIQVDPYSLPAVFDDENEQVIRNLRSLFIAAEKCRQHRRRMFYACAFVFVCLTASFIVRYWR